MHKEMRGRGPSSLSTAHLDHYQKASVYSLSKIPAAPMPAPIHMVTMP